MMSFSSVLLMDWIGEGKGFDVQMASTFFSTPFGIAGVSLLLYSFLSTIFSRLLQLAS